MATSPITAWQIEGEKVETVIDFLFSAFQHTVSVCHCFPAKKQLSSEFMAAVTIHSDFEA